MGGMSEREERRGGYRALLFAAMPAALPILYVLSTGPTLTLVASGHSTTETWQSLYWPLIYVSNLSPVIYDAWQWYLWLWTG
jgi:hypothetical protein